MPLLKGEGETLLVRRTRVRVECENCGEPAVKRTTYLLLGDRRNPRSSAFGKDDCSWCSDHEVFLCEACPKPEHEIPGYSWCGEFTLSERFAHMFLYWHEVLVVEEEKRT